MFDLCFKFTNMLLICLQQNIFEYDQHGNHIFLAGMWGIWTEWDLCFSSIQTRGRICLSIPLSRCKGSIIDTRPCFTTPSIGMFIYINGRTNVHTVKLK